MNLTTDELWDSLLRIHREVFLPEFQREVIEPFRDFQKDVRVQFERIFEKMDKMIADAGATRRSSSADCNSCLAPPAHTDPSLRSG